MTREARVSAPNVLVRQPQDTHPLRLNCLRWLAGLTIAGVTAKRCWIGTYPEVPHLQVAPENELELGEASVAGEFVSVPCSGGVHGTYYYVELDLQCSDGAVRSADGWVHVKDHDA